MLRLWQLISRSCHVVCHRQSNVDGEARRRKVRRTYIPPVQTNRPTGDSEAKTIPAGQGAAFAQDDTSIFCPQQLGNR